jgi:hypothetical protein
MKPKKALKTNKLAKKLDYIYTTDVCIAETVEELDQLLKEKICLKKS